MKKPLNYKNNKKVDYFDILDKQTLKPKLKFITDDVVEVKAIKKVVEKVKFTAAIKERIAELKASRDEIMYAINEKNSGTQTIQESLIEERRFELINIKKIIHSLYLR